ncbi:hypothetical protein FK268_22275 [Tsukamurella sputi]|uniref:DUF1023 domain-containing protein n=1 Tax=Tsukamurella sputi TaxID=2591848 RepID=A0A5C5RGW6_9ACTN|nr:alpha/beta hydrolase [Tsukamurella sputi]TWS21918.1 hypothetical protein FK268_22275 [Tsukamurella sputi]
MVVIDETVWRGAAADAYGRWARLEAGAMEELDAALDRAAAEILSGGGELAARLAAIELAVAVPFSGAPLGGAPSMPVRKVRSAAARDRENRRLLAADLQELRARSRTRAVAARLAALESLATRIAELEAAGETVQLFEYDPLAYGGDGIAVVAIGDLDSARNVGVVVPGMGTTLASVGAVTRNAENLLSAARRADPAATTATVAWIGYDAPSGRGSAAVLGRANAERGAAELQEDLRDIAALRDDRRLVVFGHSYGSTTAATAGARGALVGTVDAMVLLGSPGAGPVRSAKELGMPVYVARDPDDPVPRVPLTHGATRLPRLLGADIGLGVDPASRAFGAIALPAGAPGFDPGAHSGYFDEGSRSLQAFGDVLAGVGARAR